MKVKTADGQFWRELDDGTWAMMDTERLQEKAITSAKMSLMIEERRQFLQSLKNTQAPRSYSSSEETNSYLKELLKARLLDPSQTILGAEELAMRNALEQKRKEEAERKRQEQRRQMVEVAERIEREIRNDDVAMTVFRTFYKKDLTHTSNTTGSQFILQVNLGRWVVLYRVFDVPYCPEIVAAASILSGIVPRIIADLKRTDEIDLVGDLLETQDGD